MENQSLNFCMQVNAAVNSLLAPGSATNTLTPSVITPHALVSIHQQCDSQIFVGILTPRNLSQLGDMRFLSTDIYHQFRLKSSPSGYLTGDYIKVVSKKWIQSHLQIQDIIIRGSGIYMSNSCIALLCTRVHKLWEQYRGLTYKACIALLCTSCNLVNNR